MAHKTRIMHIENKGGEWKQGYWGAFYPVGSNLTGPGRIGRVTFSKTGLSITYKGQQFGRFNGKKSNYVCEQTGESFWISGPKKRGGDALYATNFPTEIDEDVREEYWTTIRNQPERKHETRTS